MKIGACISAVGGLCACVGMTQMQDTAAKFDEGVHAATAAESRLLHNIQAAQCNRDFYKAGFDFATAERDEHSHLFPKEQSRLDMRVGRCTHTELTDEQLALRMKLMDTITLYADSIQALTNGTGDAALSTESQNVASNIQALGNQLQFSSKGMVPAAALNAAVVSITRVIIDHHSYKHVKEAAASMQPHLQSIVDELKAENTSDAVGLENKADGLTNEMRAAISSSRDQQGAASFLDIIYARLTLDSLVIAPPDIASMNAALDAIVSANAALARSEKGGAIPEISVLITRAQQANALFNAGK